MYDTYELVFIYLHLRPRILYLIEKIKSKTGDGILGPMTAQVLNWTIPQVQMMIFNRMILDKNLPGAC